MLFGNRHPLIVLFTTAYIGMWAHEGTHYLAGVPWTRQHEMVFCFKIFPCSVDWSSTDVRPFVYRLSGGAPLILLLPGVLIFWYEVQPLVHAGQWFDVFVRLPLVAAGLVSRKDIQSLATPDDWMNSPE